MILSNYMKNIAGIKFGKLLAISPQYRDKRCGHHGRDVRERVMKTAWVFKSFGLICNNCHRSLLTHL